MDDRSLLQPAHRRKRADLRRRRLATVWARRSHAAAAGGYPVVIAGRNAESLRPPPRNSSTGAKVNHVVGDASRAADVARFVTAAQEFAPLAVAVHNAGSNRPAPFLKVSEERFEGHWREHALGGFHLAQAAIPALLSRGGGALIFTGAAARCAAGQFCAVRRRQSCGTRARTGRGAGRTWDSCRAHRHRRRHRGRSPPQACGLN